MTTPQKTFVEVFADLPATGWLSEREALLLWRLCLDTVGPVLEVGCYHGRSTCLLARFGRTVYVVDPFKGFDSDDPSGTATYAAFLNNIRSRGLNKLVKLYVSRIEDWAGVGLMLHPVVELAYLDGDHTYSGTLVQIDRALLCEAATIAIHDVNDEGEGVEVKRAALERLGSWDERVERLAVWRDRRKRV